MKNRLSEIGFDIQDTQNVPLEKVKNLSIHCEIDFHKTQLFKKFINLKILTIDLGYPMIIPSNCFSHCPSLEQLTLVSPVIDIEKRGVEYMKMLRKVYIDTETISFEDLAFSCCSYLSSVTFLCRKFKPKFHIFSYHTVLTEKGIKKGMLEIADDSFESSGLCESIYLPERCLVGKRAFYNCGNLEKIDCSSDGK